MARLGAAGEVAVSSQESVTALIQQYLHGDQNSEGRTPTAREASFDYCFNHFQKFREEQRMSELAEGDNLERSCLHLAFYLASWGMFRGSSFLLNKSLRHFVPVVQLIASTPAETWDIDICRASNEEIDKLIKLERDIAENLSADGRDSTVTLTTKVMLGVFGNVPAIDTFVFAGLKKARGYNADALDRASAAAFAQYYRDYQSEFDALTIYTLDFFEQQETARQYPAAKKVDMALFMLGR